MISAISDIIMIVIKYFGQINLKKILASEVLTSLLIAGAIRRDWNRVIPMIIPELIIGINLIILTILNNDICYKYVLNFFD